ncbi:NAD(P)/FAD-dependent oxidoreductase [Brachybacterium sp. FME24]|uniref:NAD(P)/FAD-dependent oxidoreductase n=1 Tax=Brachybacterium sp. FME24 TaxID=2742605 RepID=UPI00186902C6|nr:NAD(P)/FAD-dependent oxidoreductase [Brachybacterium sp. FME24]
MTTPESASAPTATAADALPTELLDVAVIGGGAAGLNGALMLVRSRRSVVVIDSGSPRNAPADAIHGLLGNEGTPPAEYLERGRREVRQYGGLIVSGAVVSARAAEPSAEGDLRFELELADGRRLTARRLLVATGLRDELPEIPGLAEHWGQSLVHCPFCHGWEVRDEPIGIIATRPASTHQALMFRQLSDDIIVFTHGFTPDEESRERCAARGISIIETGVQEIVPTEGGDVAGVRLIGGELVPRSVLVAASVMHPRTEGLDGLGLALEEVPGGMGEKISTSFAGATEVPGVWVAGNAADPSAQVGPSAAAGSLAGGHINGMLVMADADAAVAAQREGVAV